MRIAGAVDGCDRGTLRRVGTFEDGVSQKEFYLSSEAGLRASASVELWTVDYEGEQFCRFLGKRYYRVLRSFKSSFDCTTLILTEVLR